MYLYYVNWYVTIHRKLALSRQRPNPTNDAHILLLMSGVKISLPIFKITMKVFVITAINGFLAMALGMTLILYALRTGNVGIVALLSSTTPILLLPMIWVYTKQRPNRFAWFGAILAVSGTSILVYK
jgi:drug/metabolite transporter (DMT)-like permease